MAATLVRGFPARDDLLDYTAPTTKHLGKMWVMTSMRGKPTLPLLHAMRHGTPEQSAMIRTAIEQGNGRHLQGTGSGSDDHLRLAGMDASASGRRSRQRKRYPRCGVLPDDTPTWREALIGLAHTSRGAARSLMHRSLIPRTARDIPKF